jgi:hypothetical protein
MLPKVYNAVWRASQAIAIFWLIFFNQWFTGVEQTIFIPGKDAIQHNAMA